MAIRSGPADAPATTTAKHNQAGELARGSLRTIDAVAISISVLSPAMAMQLNTGGVAAVAGGSTPLSFLLGGIGCLALGFVVVGFTRRMAAAGYAYTYLSRSLGKKVGFLGGWMYAFGFAAFVPMTMAGVGALSASLLNLGGAWWFYFFLMGMALLVVLSLIRVKITTKVQLLVGVVTVAILLVVDLIVTGKGGAHGQSAGAFTFSHTVSGGFHGVFYGLILGITSYIGFETAADFGEETSNPRRSVPIAVIAAVTFAILFYVFTTYATTIGYGTRALQKNPTPWVNNGVAGVADVFVSHAVGTLVEISALFSAFIVCVACATAGSRTLFAMGREGVLPTWFGQTHPRFKTPINATSVIAVVATVVAAIVGFGFGNKSLGGDAFTVYYLLATIGTLAVVLVYIGLCLGSVGFFYRTSRRFNPLIHGLIPLIGAVIFGAALYGSIWPLPPSPIDTAIYITAAWLVVGLGALAWIASRRPEAIERIGSILGEEGGELVEALDQA
ncbi:MAG TPA: APC family permease [Acidimicrobiales bacterium]|nr:APC family permease [Acidimicrobiales bacterium]